MSVASKVSVVTGAAGLLGGQFSDTLLEAGSHVCLLDIDELSLSRVASELGAKYPGRCVGIVADITSETSLHAAREKVLERFGKIDILINNAALNPKVQRNSAAHLTRLENFELAQWEKDLSVGLTGAFLCCKVFGAEMAANRSGVIANIASDLSVIAPDQRIYRKAGLADDRQPVKPVTYSVIKTGLLGLTRYLATYWADSGVRVNALSPGGVFVDQPEEFTRRLTNLIPMGRMATVDEYRGAILFLCSDASKYMTGQNLVVDGGRSVW